MRWHNFMPGWVSRFGGVTDGVFLTAGLNYGTILPAARWTGPVSPGGQDRALIWASRPCSGLVDIAEVSGSPLLRSDPPAATAGGAAPMAVQRVRDALGPVSNTTASRWSARASAALIRGIWRPCCTRRDRDLHLVPLRAWHRSDDLDPARCDHHSGLFAIFQLEFNLTTWRRSDDRRLFDQRYGRDL